MTTDEWPSPDSASARLNRRGKQVLAGGNRENIVHMDPFPIYSSFGSGPYLTDADGIRRVDFLNNFTSLIHGHAHPAIVARVTEQVALGSALTQPNEWEIQLAELLCGRVPSIERVLFTNSGTEAAMTAIKAARASTGRTMFAKCEGAYHGTYDQTEVSLGAGPENWGTSPPNPVPYVPGTAPGVLAQTLVLPHNDPSAAADTLREHAGKLACIIVDPYRGGKLPANPEFVKELRRFASEDGCVLIFDEVISFRLGFSGAQGEMGIKPDLTVLGKIIGGGFPIGAVGGRRNVMSVFERHDSSPLVPHGGTFSGNPVSMAAGYTALDLLTPEAISRLNQMGAELRDGIAGAFENTAVKGQVTGTGSLFKMYFSDHLITDYRGAYPTADSLARQQHLHRFLLDRGMLLSPTLFGALSTVLEETHIGDLISAIQDGLGSM